MKKLHIIIGCVFLHMVLFTACFSGPKPRPLDLAEISGSIPIYSVEVIIRKDMDVGGMGAIGFNNVLLEEIDSITEALLTAGIHIDTEAFLDEYNSSPYLQFEELNLMPGFVLHRYYWNSQTKPELRMELQLTIVVLEDGSMPLHARIKKDDPDYAPGYLMERILYISNTDG